MGCPRTGSQDSLAKLDDPQIEKSKRLQFLGWDLDTEQMGAGLTRPQKSNLISGYYFTQLHCALGECTVLCQGLTSDHFNTRETGLIER